jgi:uncharacterized protein (DUF433 family)
MPEQQITSNPDIMMGKPVVTGTRITVEQILDKLGAGETIDQILNAHPRLSIEGVRAALRYASDVLKSDVVFPIETASR